jgi:hypothetical protein
MPDHDTEQRSNHNDDANSERAWEEAGEEDVPTVVLYIIAGMLIISFTLYLVVGGGHNHFH